jgi:hypothetical protein
MKNEIEYVPDGIDLNKYDSEKKKRFNELYKMPLKDVLEAFDKSSDKETVLNDDYYIVRDLLRDLLNVPTSQEVNTALDSLKTMIEDLDAKMRNHRHDTTKQYSAKPEF